MAEGFNVQMCGRGVPDVLIAAYADRCSVDNYRLRLAVWTCSEGAFLFDDQTPVTIIFTQPTTTSEYVVGDLLFPNLYNDDEFGLPRTDEERVCWVFLRMYWLLTNWQNIIREIERELEEAVSLRFARFGAPDWIAYAFSGV